MGTRSIIVIVGPTSSGKSDLAIQLAKRLNGEVISADSRQVYKGMDLGTGKVIDSDIPHHLLDVASPKRRFTVQQFQKKARQAIKDIQKRNKLPIVCGGTNFYVKALIDGIVFPETKPNLKQRKELEKLSTEELYEKLKKLDARRAKDIDRNNPPRLIRAIEIALDQGSVPPTKLSPVPAFWIGVDKTNLEQRIKQRLEERLNEGMIEEVKELRKTISFQKLEDFGLEYRYISYYLQNKLSYEEMKKQLLQAIIQFAKRQRRELRQNKRIVWIVD
jgi:tRNA dimethylallyltransferase